jgi:hypothetical protein
VRFFSSAMRYWAMSLAAALASFRPDGWVQSNTTPLWRLVRSASTAAIGLYSAMAVVTLVSVMPFSVL